MINLSGKGKLITLLSILSVCVLVAFFLIVNRPDNKNYEGENGKSGEVAILLSKSVESSYPATPYEVVKLYARIIKALYNESCTDEEFTDLADMQRLLFDAELLAQNERETFIKNLQVEVANAKKKTKTIVVYSVQDQKQVKTWKAEDGYNYSSLKLYFLIKEGSKYTDSYEEFVLREGDDNKYRILGWRATDAFKTDK
ncbi:MAG: hypothetical protein K6B75_07695 [Lachnospiraceae bacterium]|nr:hypothetical protein [Lachnospiraceae bacterium]